MNLFYHTSAQSSHYNKEAKTYDAFNEENSACINTTIESVLKQYNVRTVLDVTCGTGSQVFWLAERGYRVIGSDFNQGMLAIARDKAKEKHLDIDFIEGDMRTISVGTFDAVLSIFNAVGHLTKDDFELAMRTAHSNLNLGGLYLFDIFNLEYFLHGDNITKLTIDWITKNGDVTERIIQYSTITHDGVLGSATTAITQNGSEQPTVRHSVQTLQIYSAHQLCAMLERNGFKVLAFCGIDGSKFASNTTERLLVVAQGL